MTKLHRQSLVAYGQPLCETVVDLPHPARQRSAGARRAAAASAIPTCICRTAILRWAATSGSTSPRTARCRSRWATRSPASSKRRARRPKARAIGRRVAVYPWIGCGNCAGLPRRRGESVLHAPSSRHRRRRRLRHPRAGSASALSARLRAAVAGLRRTADVLGPHRLFGAQAARRPGRARPGAAGRHGRRRHDGPRHRARAVSRAAARRRHRCRQARRPRSRPARRKLSIRPIRRRAGPSWRRPAACSRLAISSARKSRCNSRPACSAAAAKSW